MGLVIIKMYRNRQKNGYKSHGFGGVTSEPYNKSINRSTEYTNALESDFEKLWQLYPNKKGK